MRSASDPLLYDIGGTWIKASRPAGGAPPTKRPSPLAEGSESRALLEVLLALAADLGSTTPDAVIISTAGVVNAHGSAIDLCSPHLIALLDPSWIDGLEAALGRRPYLVNDADCALIGAVERGLVRGPKTVGLMVIGTGLGFTIWRNGRRWRPGWSDSLLGLVELDGRSLDATVSASRLASRAPDGNLLDVLTAPQFASQLETYLARLGSTIRNAGLLYSLDEVAISGGLVDACISAGLDLRQRLAPHLQDPSPKVRVFDDGNALQLTGARALADAEVSAESARFVGTTVSLTTEQAHDPSLRLEHMTAAQLVATFLQTEAAAARDLEEDTATLAAVAEQIAERLRAGGRLIYVGCGSSGRLAALDAVELPCTYGLAKDRAICLIAGGVADAAIDIEHRFEEDASASPELLLLDVTPRDTVLGISASGSAHYVRSALAVAKQRGALSVLISTNAPDGNFYDHHLDLRSGSEVVSGSTRMKAGTATKKILNVLSSTAMIRLGKVRGTRMIDLACLNQKLIARAEGILRDEFDLPAEEARRLLESHEFRLLDTIRALEKPSS